MLMKKKVTVYLGILIIFAFACSKQEDKGKIKEGKVEYKITYLENKMSIPMPTHLLPSKLILKFKDDKSVMGIQGIMGVFSLKMITDHKKNTTVTLMKVMEKKLFHQGSPEDGMFLFKPIEGMRVELRAGQKEIAGLNCKRGRVIFPGTNEEQPFIFYYTEDLNIDEPNRGNPYEEVEGVLVKFQMQLNKLRMDLTATEAKAEEIKDSEFDIPEGYRQISREDMDDLLNSFLK